MFHASLQPKVDLVATKPVAAPLSELREASPKSDPLCRDRDTFGHYKRLLGPDELISPGANDATPVIFCREETPLIRGPDEWNDLDVRADLD